MIDPKLNKVPVDKRADADEVPASELSPEERAAGARRPRPGLSIKDTVAGETVLSVGAPGVNVSGVAAGAGAGAGMTSVTPAERGESPAPNIVPGGRSAGTTPLGTTGVDRSPTTRLDEGGSLTEDEIAARAYRCWHERGCPEGSPEVDWCRAEEELRKEREKQRRSTAASA